MRTPPTAHVQTFRTGTAAPCTCLLGTDHRQGDLDALFSDSGPEC